jgi:hypothetical protein
MKVNIVKDGSGKVVATFENAVAGSPRIVPVLKPGHTIHEVDAPENYAANMKAFYEQHSTAKQRRPSKRTKTRRRS